MIIPIQRDGATSPSSLFSSTSPSTYTNNNYTSKKTVRITPKITDVEVLPRTNAQQNGNGVHHTTVPVSILSSSKSTSTKNTKSDWNDLSNSALNMFESGNKRWVRDDMDDFLLPSLTSPKLLKDKFDNFSNQAMTSMSMPLPAFRQMQMHHHPIRIDTFVAESDKYVLTLNVEKFKPEEIQVKVTDDTISVTGKHEEKQDETNFSCSEYSRKHTLPPGVKADDVKCSLSLGGILTISAPRRDLPALQQRERTVTIPINHSGSPAIRV